MKSKSSLSSSPLVGLISIVMLSSSGKAYTTTITETCTAAGVYPATLDTPFSNHPSFVVVDSYQLPLPNRLFKRSPVGPQPVVESRAPLHIEEHVEKKAHIKHPLDYAIKADSRETGSTKWEDQWNKRLGAQYNHPKYSQTVIDAYTTKIQEAKAKLKETKDEKEGAILSKKIALWEKEKLPEWTHRRETLSKLMLEQGKDWSNVDPKINAKMEPYSKQKVEESERLIKERLQRSSGKSSDSLQKRGPVIHDAVHYYKKADSHRNGDAFGLETAKHYDNKIKAAGARFNYPSASEKVVKNYQEKIQSAEKKLPKIQDVQQRSRLASKMKSWENDKIPLWEQRVAKLHQVQKETANLDRKSWHKDSKVEEKVNAYQNERASQGITPPLRDW